MLTSGIKLKFALQENSKVLRTDSEYQLSGTLLDMQ